MNEKGAAECKFIGGTPRLPSSNLERTIDFYRQTLGFELGVLWPGKNPAFCILQRGGVKLAFDSADNPIALPKESLGFYIDVDDARALHESIRDRIEIEWGPEIYRYQRREFAFRDPDGYLIIISEGTDDPPTCEEE